MQRAWVLVLVGVSGCGLVRGSGNRVSEPREIPVFTELTNASQIDVRINGDGTPNTLTCDDNLLELIVTEVRNDRLEVRLKPGASFVSSVACVLDVQATVLERVSANGSGDVQGTGPFDDVEAVSATGSGDVTLSDLNADGLSVVCSGSGDVALSDVKATTVTVTGSGSGDSTLEGNASNATLTNSGSGDIDTRALPVATAVVTVSGSGSILLSASESVTGTISGSGDVRVAGGATIDVRSTGSGEAVPE